MAAALKITGINEATSKQFVGFTRLDLEDGTWVHQSPAWMGRHHPEVGGYFMESDSEQWFSRAAHGDNRLIQCVQIEVAKLELGKGDVLALRFTDGVPPQFEQAQILERLRGVVPGVTVMFLGPNVEPSVIKQADVAAAESEAQ